ncbi:hypothetical protein TNCV_4414761 [Trichonephila clavipes]|uniref:Uncharacterized protein n=1 Tax=Trichonephila clavipes TaxID=2585209 RepID=A0A8X6VDZ3_TRICX|nr:hypothetical protein TNCV_4414761 [Trichonephila clavipes]
MRKRESPFNLGLAVEGRVGLKMASLKRLYGYFWPESGLPVTRKVGHRALTLRAPQLARDLAACLEEKFPGK